MKVEKHNVEELHEEYIRGTDIPVTYSIVNGDYIIHMTWTYTVDDAINELNHQLISNYDVGSLFHENEFTGVKP